MQRETVMKKKKERRIRIRDVHHEHDAILILILEFQPLRNPGRKEAEGSRSAGCPWPEKSRDRRWRTSPRGEVQEVVEGTVLVLAVLVLAVGVGNVGNVGVRGSRMGIESDAAAACDCCDDYDGADRWKANERGRRVRPGDE